MDNVTEAFTSANNETDTGLEPKKFIPNHYLYTASLLLFFIIFPFYEYVYLKNREKEKDTIVYPVINHFYNVLRFSYKLFVFYLLMIVPLVIVLLLSTRHKSFNKPAMIMIGIMLVCMLLLRNSMRTNIFLLCLLSFQKFMVLFYPNTEKYVALNEKGVKRFIWTTYALVLISWVMQIFQGPNLIVIYFVATDIMIITSASLYIPIYRMIKKQKHLSSAQFHKPHRYVMWQLIAILLCKLVQLPIILQAVDITDAMVNCENNEIATTFLTIQLAYLGCCKRNLESLKSFLLEKWWIRLLLCKCMNSNRVAPIERPINNLEVLQRF
ncbi:hypothetical protein CRE_19854 [Caenorhabditis remanei]|uniref:Uncharacterized protein n=1 Tax=Caenorhabditis remanei TaxID=31234 RepID=E3MTP0_CAERE|nr:hypothetical protein CRE_19854 [Caenorhabditis remanei]